MHNDTTIGPTCSEMGWLQDRGQYVTQIENTQLYHSMDLQTCCKFKTTFGFNVWFSNSEYWGGTDTYTSMVMLLVLL